MREEGPDGGATLWTPFEKKCIALVEAAPRTHARNCFRSAVRHLDRAMALLDECDLEMCVFRSITAEEEAASGLIRAVQEKQYPGAEQLHARNHVHKSAVTPLLIAMGTFFHDVFGKHGFEPSLHLKDDEGGKRRLMLALPFSINGVQTMAYPIPPLNIGVQQSSGVLMFQHELDRYVAERGAREALEHLRELANARNQVLYARADGVPAVRDLKPGYVVLRKKRVFAMLCGYLFIFPYNERQPLVQTALNALLTMIQPGHQRANSGDPG